MASRVRPGSPRETYSAAVIGQYKIEQGDIDEGREILLEVIWHLDRQAPANRQHLLSKEAYRIARSALAMAAQRQEASRVDERARRVGDIALLPKLGTAPAWNRKLPPMLKNLEEALEALLAFLERVAFKAAILCFFGLGLWTAVHGFASAHRRPDPAHTPGKLGVTVAGRAGRQKLVISLSSNDGRPVTLYRVTVIDLHSGEIVRVETNRDGIAIHQVEFADPIRAFEVRAGNDPGLIWMARLDGPAKRE